MGFVGLSMVMIVLCSAGNGDEPERFRKIQVRGTVDNQAQREELGQPITRIETRNGIRDDLCDVASHTTYVLFCSPRAVPFMIVVGHRSSQRLDTEVFHCARFRHDLG